MRTTAEKVCPGDRIYGGLTGDGPSILVKEVRVNGDRVSIVFDKSSFIAEYACLVGEEVEVDRG